MEIVQRTIPADCTIIDTGDWHIGALNCHMKGIKKLIKRAQEPDVAAVLLKGDLIEAILPGDKRFTHCSQDVAVRTVQDQMELLTALIEPIKDKVAAVLLGNHEWKLINTLDVARELSRRLAITYGGYTCVADFGFFKAFLTHGHSIARSNAKDPIQRLANQQASLKLQLEKSGFRDCIYMSMGHIHNPIIVQPTIDREIVLTTDDKGIHQRYRVHYSQNASDIPPEARWYAANPSFLKLYAEPGNHAISYAEMAGYAPAALGWLEVDVKGGELVNVRKVEV